MENKPEQKQVYAGIKKVIELLSKSGIGKNKVNHEQRYQFRGIDDVQNALAVCLVDANLVIMPSVLERIVTERQTKSGGIMYHVLAKMQYEFISTVDNSTHTVISYGEAMDMADKATNKALSAAYKYMALTTFCIPTEGSEDADSHTPPETAKLAAKTEPKQDKPAKTEKPVEKTAVEKAYAYYHNLILSASERKSHADLEKIIGKLVNGYDDQLSKAIPLPAEKLEALKMEASSLYEMI